MQPTDSPTRRYGVAVLTVLVATLARWLCNPLWGTALPYITFFPALLIAAWYGGLGPGLLATALAALLAAYFWVNPAHSFALGGPEQFSLLVFILNAAAIILVNEWWRRREQQRHAEALQKREADYQRIVETATEGIWQVDAEMRTTYANRRMAEMLGLTVEELIGRPATDFFFPEDEPERVRRLALRQTGQGGVSELRLRRQDGAELWVLCSTTPLLGAAGEFLGAFAMNTEVSARRRAENRLRLLSEASARLAASLDLQTTIENLMSVVVPAVADVCVVDLVNKEGKFDRVGVRHHDPDKAELAEALRGYGPTTNLNEGVPLVYRTGEPLLYAELTEELLAATAHSPEHLELIRKLAPRSSITVPLRARGRPLGVLSLTLNESERRYDASDLAFAAELGRRVAVALENAQLYAASREAEAVTRAHAARLQILDENARALTAAGLDEQAILEATTRRIAELIGDIGSIRFVAEDDEHFGPATVYHRDPVITEALREADRARPERVAESFSAPVIATGKPLLIPDLSHEEALAHVNPRYRDYLRRHPVYSILIVPVRLGGRVAGALALTRTEPGHAYTEDDRRLLEELAGRTSLVLENARLHAATMAAETRAQQQAARLAVLAQVSKALAEAQLDLPKIFTTITQQVSEVLGDTCTIRLLSDDRQRLEVKAAWHRDPYARELLQVVHSSERPGIIELFQPVLETGEPFFRDGDATDEIRPLLPPASSAFALKYGAAGLQIVPLRVSGAVAGVLICARTRGAAPYTAEEKLLFQELADRTALAIEKAQLFAAVQEANRRKDDFLAMLGHELRNPIAAMLGAHRAAAAKQDAATMRQAQAILDRQIGHMSRLVDDLLDVSRITRGKILLQRERVDLAQLIRETCDDLREQAEGAGLSLALDCATEDEPIWVDGDRTRLAQMLTNLVTNAVKFTDAGGRVTVGLRVEAGGGANLRLQTSDFRPQTSDLGLRGDGTLAPGRQTPDSVVVTVRDTGIGIDAAMLPRLFDTFAQADGSLDRSRGGLGLGLALVKGLAELHGGAVTAHSDGAGCGAEFRVWLPVMERGKEGEREREGQGDKAARGQGDWEAWPSFDGHARPVAPSPRRPVAPAPSPPLSPSSSLRVLVIDDNRDSADMACVMLQLSGHTAEAVYGSRQGLAAVERMQPDAVCCDIGLPEIDGYEVARELRRRGYAGLLIAVSGYGQEEDKRQSQAAGFDAHLVKPVEPEQLEAALQALVRNQVR